MESFKELSEVLEPDPRMQMFALVNPETGKIVREKGIKDHYEEVASYKLSSKVPEEIVSLFNVSKNVLLYTYFSYAFYSVGAQHVLSTLEFAMRTRIGEEELKKIKPKGLFKYLDYVIGQGWVRNEDFSIYHEAPFRRAKREYEEIKRKEMDERGLSEILLDYSEVEVPNENNCDHLSDLKETLHHIRNDFAHGTTMLYPPMTYNLYRETTEFVNALFDESHRPDVDPSRILRGRAVLRTV